MGPIATNSGGDPWGHTPVICVVTVIGTPACAAQPQDAHCLGGAGPCRVIPCLSCPLFVYEQGITISVCVQIC